MTYVKNNQQGTSYSSVDRFIQPKNHHGISVIPSCAAAAPTQTAADAMSEVSGLGLSRPSGVIQRNSNAVSVSAVVAAADPELAIDPPQPGIHQTGFIDNDDGANIRTGPAESGGKTLTAKPLPPATRVFVGGRHPASAQWWYVNAYFSDWIVRGYIQNFRITTGLPEPGARLYQVKPDDKVEELARREFASGVRDGHDLRYYENVLLYVNRQADRNGIHGTFQNPNLWGGGSNNIQMVAGKRIWLVSPEFARQLERIVPSGSFSGGAVAKAGRIYGHIQDIVQSVKDSPRYFGEVAGEYAEVIYENLPEIITTVAGFVLAESVSASLAASPTGVGQLAALLIQLILALLGVKALAESLGEALDHAGKWLRQAWTAEGNPLKLREASKEFLHMLVAIAIAALSALGIKGNLGKGVKIANAIKIEPPSLGISPALTTDTGLVLSGEVGFYPGSVTSTGPVDIGMYSSMAAAPGKGVRDALKSESKTSKAKIEVSKADKIRAADKSLIDDMEKSGGHLIEKHVSMTNQKLITRAVREGVDATSFTDKSTAIKAVLENLRNNADEIAAWLANPKSRGFFFSEYTHSFEVGYGVEAGNKIIRYGLKRTQLYLAKDPASGLGFKMITGYPILK